MKPKDNNNIQISLYLFLVAMLCFGCRQEPGLTPTLDALATEYNTKNTPPGMAITLIKEGSPIWSYTYGYSDLSDATKMDTNVIMNIASISKTITTTAVLQLYEKGRLDLDTDINTILNFEVRNPAFDTTPITVKQLLTHTSSIADGDSYTSSYHCGPPNISLSEWLSEYFTENGIFHNAEENFLHWKPGEGYKYSNLAYGLLGLIVEEVSGQTFSNYCAQNIFIPLEMENSGWFRKEIDTTKQAHQYILDIPEKTNNTKLPSLFTKKVGVFYELCPYSFYNYPDGLFKTTVHDLSRFMMATMNGGEYRDQRILKTSSVTQMLSLQVKNYDIQGLGWKKLNYENFALWGHSGRDPGVRTHMYFHLETKTGIILFQNNDGGSTMDLVESIFDALLKNENK